MHRQRGMEILGAKRTMKINYHTESDFCGVEKREGRPCKGRLLKSLLKSEINKEGAAITFTNIKWEKTKEGNHAAFIHT